MTSAEATFRARAVRAVYRARIPADESAGQLLEVEVPPLEPPVPT